MLTRSPVLTDASRKASPHNFQFAPTKSPLQGSPGRPLSRSRQNSSVSQPSTLTTVSTAARPTSSAMSSPSKPSRAQNGAEEHAKPATADPPHDGRSPKQVVAPAQPLQTSPPPKSTNPPTAQEGPRQSQSPVKTKPNSAKRSADSAGERAPLSAPSNDGVTSHAASEEPSRPAQRPKPLPATPKILPIAYETCNIGDMVVLIAHMLSELIETNDALAFSSGNLTRFHSRTPPAISVLDYLNRLARHATLSPPLLLSMVYYIDRLCALYPEFTINTLTVHRFLITAATVAAKGLSDSFWNNATYAKVGGVRLAELKLLELEFLYRVDWRIVPNPDVLVAYYRGLVERCPGYILEQSPQSSSDEEDKMVGSDLSQDDGSPRLGSAHIPKNGTS
ncbi:related to negative regulatory factor PREG [Cephalotrichum gorgonifer]|uniref:Related to negative regulatory factor PREG n=1 Tax=Cephalotrichum gorgonifer TaxID=2041049 RepID=A0AAE8SWW1_9PEZI|nr:related to negative regulatory factor PREG [Cephalotrichum gorgonifer]